MKVVTKVNLRKTTKEESTKYDALSYSILSAYNQCPTWGAVRYGMRRKFESAQRAMALEAGSACHRAFAMHRLWDLKKMGLDKHFEFHMKRVFGDASEGILSHISSKQDDFANLDVLCTEALHSSGYYDEPTDKKRTMSALEECIMAYLRSTYSRKAKVWVQDVEDHTKLVGVELPLDYMIDIEYVVPSTGETGKKTVRYVGTMDGVAQGDQLFLEENKTGSRLDEAWEAQFALSHQVTGYMLLGSAEIGKTLEGALIHGLKIPQPKRGDALGVTTTWETRNESDIQKFFDWVLFTSDEHDLYKTDPELAPRFTHSCNRYFRPCALIPYCKLPSKEDRQACLTSDMVEAELSPSEQAAMDKHGD